MRKKLFTIGLLVVMAACAPTIYDVSHYRKDPDIRKVTSDEVTIYVLPQMGGYIAWGGEEKRDGKYIKYRQRRAIEVLSKCRIDKVVSKPTDSVLYATVTC